MLLEIKALPSPLVKLERSVVFQNEKRAHSDNCSNVGISPGTLTLSPKQVLWGAENRSQTFLYEF